MARNQLDIERDLPVNNRGTEGPDSDQALISALWESRGTARQSSGTEPRRLESIDVGPAQSSSRLASRAAALIEQEREATQLQLIDIAKAKMPWWMQVDFRQAIEGLEQRSQTQPISAQQRTDLYKQVMRLLTCAPAYTSSNGVGWDIVLAKQVMNYAAEPNKVDQGNHLTCGAAALESEMYRRDPADAARVVADVYLTKQFKPEGRSSPIVPHQSVLAPDSESNRITPHDGQRSYASQLFQGTAISVVYPGYRQIWRHNQNNFGAPQTFDEVIAWQRKTKDGLKTGYNDFDGLFPGQIQEMNRAITGNRNPLTVIERRDVNIFDGMEHVATEAEFRDLLNELKSKHELPAIAFVDSNHEPFWTDGHYGQRRRKGGRHFVCLNEFESGAPDLVAVNNQWGQLSDHGRIPSQELFLSLASSRSSKYLAELKLAVDSNTSNGVVDTVLEFELLRRQREAGTITGDQFSTRLETVLNDHKERVKKGEVPDEEQIRVANSLQETLNFENYTNIDEISKKVIDLSKHPWSSKIDTSKSIRELLGESPSRKWPESFNKQQAKGK